MKRSHYLLYARSMMIKNGVEPIQDEPIQLELAGNKFFRQVSRMRINGMTIQQALIVTVVKGHALAFILIGKEQQTMDEMTKAVGTLNFEVPPPIRRGVTTVIGDTSPKAKPSPSSPSKPEPSPGPSQGKSKTSPRP